MRTSKLTKPVAERTQEIGIRLAPVVALRAE